MKNRDRIRNALIDRLIVDLDDESYRADAVSSELKQSPNVRASDLLQPSREASKEIIAHLEKLRTQELKE